MSPPRLHTVAQDDADEALPAELLAIIEALAEADARRDYAAAHTNPESV